MTFGDHGVVGCVTTEAFRVDDLTDVEVLEEFCLEILTTSMLEDGKVV